MTPPPRARYVRLRCRRHLESREVCGLLIGSYGKNASSASQTADPPHSARPVAYCRAHYRPPISASYPRQARTKLGWPRFQSRHLVNTGFGTRLLREALLRTTSSWQQTRLTQTKPPDTYSTCLAPELDLSSPRSLCSGCSGTVSPTPSAPALVQKLTMASVLLFANSIGCTPEEVCPHVPIVYLGAVPC